MEFFSLPKFSEMQIILKSENDAKTEIYRDPHTSYKHLSKGDILVRTPATDCTFICLFSYTLSPSFQKNLEPGKMY